MRKLPFLILTTLLTQPLYALWFCEESKSDTSDRVTWYVCGQGIESNEPLAMSAARQDANKEMNALCTPSIDCNPYEWVVEPGRTKCVPFKESVQCHRLYMITITDKKRDMRFPRQFDDGEQQIYTQKKRVQEVELPDNYTKNYVTFFSSEPVGASVTVDGVQLCSSTPCSRELSIGKHRVEISGLTNYTQVKEDILVKESEQIYTYKLWYTKSIIRFLGKYPDDVQVFIDGQKYEEFPNPSIVNPGEHVVEYRSPYYASFYKKISLKEGAKVDLTFESVPLKGKISIAAIDPSGNALALEVYIDGKKQNEKTPAVYNTTAGKHQIEVTDNERVERISAQVSAEKIYVEKVVFGGKPSKEVPKWRVSFDLISNPQGAFKEENTPSWDVALPITYDLTRELALRFTYELYTSNQGSVQSASSSDKTLSAKEFVGHMFKFSSPYYLKEKFYLTPVIGLATFKLTYRKNDDTVVVENDINVQALLYGLETGYTYMLSQSSGPRFLIGLQKFQVLQSNGSSGTAQLGHDDYRGKTNVYGGLGWEWRF